MPIKVAFLTFYYEAWDALDEVWRIMGADPRFETTVISIPRLLTGDTEFGGEEKVIYYLTQHGVPHLRFEADQIAAAAGEDSPAVRRLREIAPDYVFVNYPWRRNYPSSLRPEGLAKFTRVVHTCRTTHCLW